MLFNESTFNFYMIKKFMKLDSGTIHFKKIIDHKSNKNK